MESTFFKKPNNDDDNQLNFSSLETLILKELNGISEKD